MAYTGELARENAALRNRLSKLSEASLRINESLDFDTVLQDVVDRARDLTRARYGALTVLTDDKQRPDFVVSGMTPEDRERLWEMPDGMRFFEYFIGLEEPLRVAEVASHMRGLGLPEFRSPIAISSLLMAPIRHQSVGVGAIFLTKGDRGGEFTLEDEQTLVMFASQAAAVIANARRYREERCARADLETLVNTSPVGVLVFNAKTGVLKSINREVRRIASGLHEPGISAESLLDVVRVRRADGRQMPIDQLSLAQAMRLGETVRMEETVIQVPDGRSVTALINATPIRSEDGEVQSFVVTLQDMKPIEELKRLRSEFLAMVSHELRAPLSSIKGSSTTALGTSRMDPAETRQFFRIIDEQADRMRDLINDLLDVTRIETGALPVSPESSDVVSLVDRARSAFQSGGARSALEIDLPPDLPRVMADGGRIVQVLDNLLSNASRHSPQGSVIRISALPTELHVEVSVSDEGGVPVDALPQLFSKRLGQRDGGDGADVSRPGLGLAICRGIVEAHGGRIWAESDGVGAGARFTFTIPVADETAPTPAHLSRRVSSADRERTRVLVVDDDPQALRYVRDTLTVEGFSVAVTGEPGDVEDLIESERPHLVLLDLMLPGTDGIELMSTLKGLSEVPVIFLSAYGRDQYIARAFEMGASDYVVKPFSPTELVARIRAALRARAAPARGLPSAPFVLGDLRVDYAERGVSVAGRAVSLTLKEFGVLAELSINVGRPVNGRYLLQRVWSASRSDDLRPVRTVVKNLRRKLGDNAADPIYIFTVPQLGYRLAKP